MIIGIVSGYFSIFHQGHQEYIFAAKDRCKYLIVIINNDVQGKLKGSKSIIDENHKCSLMKGIKGVDEVILSIDKDKTVCQTLIHIREKYQMDDLIFFNSGDRVDINNTDISELEICKKYNIKYVAINLPKIYSSNNILQNFLNKYHE